MALEINLDKACTVCLHESESDSIQWAAVDNGIQEKIVKCFPSFYEEATQEFPKPHKICCSCLEDLNAAYRFHINCERTENLLLQYASQYILSNYIEQVTDLDEAHLNENDNKSNTSAEEGDKTQYEEYSELEQNDYDCIEEGESTELPLLENPENENEVIVQNSIDHQNSKISVAKNEFKEQNLKRFKSKLSKTNRDSSYYAERSTKNTKHLPKICELCGNSYKYQYALKAHMRRHLNDRPFKCEFCEKKFYSNVELRRHMRVHTGAKPYGCSFCDRTFSDFGSRIKHERTHTGERPFVCETCNKCFAYAHVLTVHMRTHTGEKKFKCSECERGFTKKSYLDVHMRLHSQSADINTKHKGILNIISKQKKGPEDVKESVTNILKCSKCGAGFTKKSSMMLHMEKCNTESAIISEVVDNFDASLGDCITAYIIEEDYGENSEKA